LPTPASQINGCGWCVDMHTKEAAAAGETAVRLNLVAAWRESTVFTEAEQAALALAEEGTRLADAHHGVSDETWAQVRKHYDDDQIAALVCLVALINAANRLAVILHQKGGSLRARHVRHLHLTGPHHPVLPRHLAPRVDRRATASPKQWPSRPAEATASPKEWRRGLSPRTWQRRPPGAGAVSGGSSGRALDGPESR
jgi:AhpD family alkylhydroperoxidase